MEEDQNWLDKPSEERNLTKDQKGLATLLCTPLRTLERKVWPEGLCSSEGNTSLCWVCRYMDSKLDRSGAGVHSSVVDPSSLAILPFHYLSSLINPIVDWLG